MSTSMTREQVTHALLNVPPLIAEEIQIREFNYPTMYSTLFQLKEWPLGAATTMQQVIMKPNMPNIERGFSSWKDLGGATAGCEGCPPKGCTVIPSKIGGHSFESKITTLMQKDYETEEFCVDDIMSTHDFENVMTQVVNNLSNQIKYIKEKNIAENYLTQISQKLLVDSEGIKGNSSNPFIWRPVGSVVISRINFEIMDYLYAIMIHMPDLVPMDMQDGRPVYGMMISSELLSDMYRLDNNVRNDFRYSTQADDLIKKIAPTTSLRGEFIPFINEWPRRFKVVAGEFVEIFPYAVDIPGDVGFYADINPEYLNATHESVTLYPMTPLTVYTRGKTTSLPGNAEFGEEPSFFEYFEFNNIKDKCDNRWQSKGFYQTRATIGLDYEHSAGVYEIMFLRRPPSTLASFFPVAVCPPEEVICADNVVAAVTCPCPSIISVEAHPLTAGTYFIRFATPIVAVAEDPIQLGLLSGGFVTGEVVAISTDGLLLEVTFDEGVTINTCREFTTVFCVNTLVCSSPVLSTNDCRSGITGSVVLQLQYAIKAYTAAQVLSATFGDGTTANIEIVSADLVTNQWTVQYATGYGPTDLPTGVGTDAVLNAQMCCDRGGIIFVCVPTATVAGCPGCTDTGVTEVVCSDE
jgi:hypothetical protein